MKDAKHGTILNNISRLHWACRRGMLELDVLLENFLKERYAALSDDEKMCFIRLLESPDPDLFAWLMGREIPPEEDFASMVERIRAHARSRI